EVRDVLGRDVRVRRLRYGAGGPGSSRGERCRCRVVREGDTGRFTGPVHIASRYHTVMWSRLPVGSPNWWRVPGKSHGVHPRMRDECGRAEARHGVGFRVQTLTPEGKDLCSPVGAMPMSAGAPARLSCGGVQLPPNRRLPQSRTKKAVETVPHAVDPNRA